MTRTKRLERVRRAVATRGQGWTGTIARRISEVLSRAATDERGQTVTEYLMISGIMAAVVVAVFATIYWNEVRDAASEWVSSVGFEILGERVP